MPLHPVSSPGREADRPACRVLPWAKASRPLPRLCTAAWLLWHARQEGSEPLLRSAPWWGQGQCLFLSMGIPGSRVGGGLTPSEGSWPWGHGGVGKPWRGLVGLAPLPSPHLYPLTLAPILCDGFCSHPHLQDLQGSKLGLGTGKLSGQVLSARRQWVFPPGSQTTHRRPLCPPLPAVDGLPGPVPL